MKRTHMTIAALVFVFGAAHGADEAAVRALIDEAEAARAEAAALEFEWRWTAKYIKDARKALAEGDLAAAEELAARAKREGELAVEQAKKADVVWELALPK